MIGFEEPRLVAAWKTFCDSGKYQSVLTTLGGMREHYGLTDPKEFFAEMTECYFGSNDFYPFVAGELKQAEPETFALLAEIWGPLPGSAPLAGTMQLETTNEHEFTRMGQGIAASRSVASEASSVEAPGCRAKSTKMPVFIGVH